MTKIGKLKDVMSELQSSIEEIEQNNAAAIPMQSNNQIANATSILQECELVIKKHSTKPKLRVLHHMACSGGTVVSKCVASLPNIFVLSELHPTSQLHMGRGKAKFLPADITTQARYAGVPNVDELAWKLFINNVIATQEHIEKLGGTLVIREHSHSDYCVGNSIADGSSLIKYLESHFDILSVVTIRNPIDAYLSLISNDWEHFEPKGFDEYCKRVLAFISEFKDTQVIRYEDIVKEPNGSIARITELLQLSYSESFIDTFSTVNMTGDSGRSGTTICERPRREVPDALQQQIDSSSSFRKIADIFGYD